MTRIAGTNIPDNKRTEVALRSIFGIGKTLSTLICTSINIDRNSKLSQLSEEKIEKIRAEVSKLLVEGHLRRQKSLNIKRLVDLHTHRGNRHRHNLPVRGQRTKTNARTCKGPRKLIKK